MAAVAVEGWVAAVGEGLEGEGIVAAAAMEAVG